ncbi:MAG: type III polyketide synthase, partial [Chitinophagaceae bacterium]
GCYAALHALKLGDAICKADKDAQVLIVCTELCTLHFQKEATMDNMASSLLFGDGSSAVLLMSDDAKHEGVIIDSFYSEINPKGKRDMAWELSSSGFLMTLSGYVPDLIEEDFAAIVERAMAKADMKEVSHWCIHPGGKKILQAIQKSLALGNGELQCSYDVLREFGNLSSASILFVLKKVLEKKTANQRIFGAAFGPGLTVETFTAHS